MRALKRWDNALDARQEHECVKAFLVSLGGLNERESISDLIRCTGVLSAPNVLEVGVLGTDAGIVKTRGDGVHSCRVSFLILKGGEAQKV